MVLLETIARACIYQDQVWLRLGDDFLASIEGRLDRLRAEGLNIVVKKVAEPVLQKGAGLVLE